MNMSVYSYMANNKKKWRAVYRYTDFTGKRRQTQNHNIGIWKRVKRDDGVDGDDVLWYVNHRHNRHASTRNKISYKTVRFKNEQKQNDKQWINDGFD